jgi:hypothetical protein
MNPRIAVLAALAVLATACQVTPAGSSTGPAPGPLAAADAKLYSGDYDGAEAAYKKLADGGDATAKAHYAILLDYENRFSEAVGEARSAAGDSPTGIALASLTRALDWSEDVTGALDAGSRAVGAAAADPLAHAFYSEALSDSAHYPVARSQLLAAEKAARDPYAKSEVEREWANYYRGQGDVLEELNHLELSLRAQPAFPERVLELARYRYADQEQDAARKLLAGLVQEHGGDYGVDVAAADTAFIRSDTETAEALYRAALKVQPTGAAASLGEAELLVSAKRDFQGAHDLLAAALRAHPDAADVYHYLYYLDVLVLKTGAVAELAGIPSVAPALPDPASRDVFDRVAAFRSTLGLPAPAESAQLSQAAQAHAYFWLFNFDQAAVAGTKIHTEDPSLPGAFGADPAARAANFGYGGQRVAEVISHVYLAGAAVDHWVDGFFHRYPLADPETVSAGFGEAQVGALSIQVLDLGQDPASRHDPVVYPVPDQSGVPFAFLGGEIPDPAPAATYPTGYPITLQVGSGSELKVSSVEVIGPDGADLDGYALDSSNAEMGANQWGVLPRDPLTPGARYTVKLSGTIDGQAFDKNWSFTVSVQPA